MREARLIIRDLRGKRFRTTSVLISVAVLVSLFFSTSVLEVGSRKASLAGSEKFGADMMILPPIVPETFSYESATGPIFVVERPEGYLNGSLVDDLLRLPGVAATSPQRFIADLNRSSTGPPSRLVAFDPGTDFVVRAWLNHTLTGLQRDEAVAGPRTNLSVGNEVSYDGLGLKIVAVLHTTNSPLDQTILFPIQAAYALPRLNGSLNSIIGEVSALMMKLAPNASPSVVESEVKNELGSFRVVEASGLVSRVSVDTTGIASYELLAGVIMAASVFLLIALVFSMSGGALAAKHYLINSTKQISPKVLKALRGKRGRTGKTGAPGATGPTGAKGDTGQAGNDGAPGTNGTSGKDGAVAGYAVSDTNSVNFTNGTVDITMSESFKD